MDNGVDGVGTCVHNSTSILWGLGLLAESDFQDFSASGALYVTSENILIVLYVHIV